MANLEKLVDDLSALTVLEAAELSKKLEEKWGVSAAAPVAETPHFSSSFLDSSAASRTVRAERSSTSLSRLAMVQFPSDDCDVEARVQAASLAA